MIEIESLGRSHLRPSGFFSSCALAAHVERSSGWAPTSGKLRLPPRQSRGKAGGYCKMMNDLAGFKDTGTRMLIAWSEGVN